MIWKKGLCILILVFGTVSFSHSQKSPEYLAITGKIMIDRKFNGNITVEIKNEQSTYMVDTLKSSRNFKYRLPFGEKYKIFFEAPSFYKRTVVVNTMVADSLIKDGFAPFDFNVLMMKTDDPRQNEFVRRVYSIFYNPSTGDFDYKTDAGDRSE